MSGDGAGVEVLKGTCLSSGNVAVLLLGPTSVKGTCLLQDEDELSGGNLGSSNIHPNSTKSYASYPHLFLRLCFLRNVSKWLARLGLLHIQCYRQFLMKGSCINGQVCKKQVLLVATSSLTLMFMPRGVVCFLDCLARKTMRTVLAVVLAAWRCLHASRG